MPIQLRAIADADLPRVAEFLQGHYKPAKSKERWLGLLRTPWVVEAPNRGFMLLDGDAIVGVYVAHYSEQEIDGRQERFCNLGVWQVQPEQRMHSLRLLKAMVDQDGYHFTDLTPHPNVVALDTRLGFQKLDTEAYLIPCLPWPTVPGGDMVTSEPAALERALSGADLDRYRDHAAAVGLRHVAIESDAGGCYLALRPSRHRRLPTLTVLHVGDPAVLRRNARAFARHLLIHHRVAGYVAERRLIDFRPRLSVRIPDPQVRMFRSDTLRAEDIDYLYSEMACIPR